MKALCWHGKSDIRYETVPDPTVQDGRDVVIKVTSCAICGSDLHIYDGVIPEMESGDVIGHETMGEVVEVGKEVTNLKIGDRVVVPFTISCGECYFCTKGHTPPANAATRIRRRPKSFGVIPRLGCSAIRTSSAATPAGRRSTCAFRSQTSVR